MLYRLKRLYLKDPLFNINVDLGHLLGETPTLLQKFVMLCGTVNENVAYFMTNVNHIALYFCYQRMGTA